MQPWIPSGSVAPMFYPQLCASFAIKTYDYGKVPVLSQKVACEQACLQATQNEAQGATFPEGIQAKTHAHTPGNLS